MRTVPKGNVNACEDFCLLVSTHILTATMDFLRMDVLDSEPSHEMLPPDVWMHDQQERQSLLYTLSSLVVSEFVDLDVFSKGNVMAQILPIRYTCMPVNY